MYLDPSMSFEYGWVRMDMDMDTGTNMDTGGYGWIYGRPS